MHVSKAISQSTRSGSSSSRLKRSKAAALSLGLCRALASVPLRGLAAALRVAGTTARYGVAAGLCAFLPKTSKVLVSWERAWAGQGAAFAISFVAVLRAVRHNKNSHSEWGVACQGPKEGRL